MRHFGLFCSVVVVLSGDGVSVRTSAQFANVLEENSHQFPLPVEKVSVGKLHVSVQFNLVPRLLGQFSIIPRLLGQFLTPRKFSPIQPHPQDGGSDSLF